MMASWSRLRGSLCACHIVDQIVDEPVLQIQEQFVDVPMPQILKEFVELVGSFVTDRRANNESACTIVGRGNLWTTHRGRHRFTR